MLTMAIRDYWISERKPPAIGDVFTCAKHQYKIVEIFNGLVESVKCSQ